MIDCNPNSTPSSLEPLDPHHESESMDKSWEYASAVLQVWVGLNNNKE